MKPIVIVSPKICKAFSIFINVGAITLFPFIISSKKMSDVTLNHEKIHIKQQAELLVIGFYALYIIYWGIALLKGLKPSEAYYAIPFEREAYDNQENFEYLSNRKWFSWTSYINKR
jgi:hypothetical protein